MTSDPMSIAIQSFDPLSKAIAEAMGPVLPPQSVHPYASSTRKVYVRAAVSLAAGHVQEYIHARHNGLQPIETFEKVDRTINGCIKQLVERPEPHLWQNCHATAMALWYVAPTARVHTLIRSLVRIYFCKLHTCTTCLNSSRIHILSMMRYLHLTKLEWHSSTHVA
jgi:hypothetical protein